MGRLHLPLLVAQYGQTSHWQPTTLGQAAALGAVLLLCLAAWVFWRTFRGVGIGPQSLRRASDIGRAPNLVFLATAAVYVCVAVVIVRRLPLTGDEPHYLMTAHSMCVDGDIDVANNYARKEYQEFGPYESLVPHAFDYKGDGALISAHGEGLPLLILPIHCLFRRVIAVRLWLALLSALAATQVFLLAYEATSDMPTAVAVWAVIAFSSPLLIFSSQLYAEVPAALGLAWAVRRILAGLPRMRDRLGLAAVVGFLPWLHTKYTLLSLMLFLAALYVLRHRGNALSGLIAPPVISGALFLFYSNQWHGSIWPFSRYDIPGRYWSFSPEYLYTCFTGGFVDREFGLITYSPVFMSAIWGLGVLFVRRRYALYLVGLMILVHLVSISPFGCEPGYSFPARHLIVIVPLLGVPLALFLKHIAGGRWLFGCLALASLFIGLVMLRNLPQAYLDYDGITGVPVVAHIRYVFPTVATVPGGSAWKPALWLLVMVGGSLAAAVDYRRRCWRFAPSSGSPSVAGDCCVTRERAVSPFSEYRRSVEEEGTCDGG